MGRLGLSGIVLAAGYSSRMGACKALLQIDGASLLERTVRLFRETGVERIVVVTGARPEIRPFAETLNVTVVENPHFDSGMFSSVHRDCRNSETSVRNVHPSRRHSSSPEEDSSFASGTPTPGVFGANSDFWRPPRSSSSSRSGDARARDFVERRRGVTWVPRSTR